MKNKIKIRKKNQTKKQNKKKQSTYGATKKTTLSPLASSKEKKSRNPSTLQTQRPGNRPLPVCSWIWYLLDKWEVHDSPSPLWALLLLFAFPSSTESQNPATYSSSSGVTKNWQLQQEPRFSTTAAETAAAAAAVAEATTTLGSSHKY